MGSFIIDSPIRYGHHVDRNRVNNLHSVTFDILHLRPASRDECQAKGGEETVRPIQSLTMVSSPPSQCSGTLRLSPGHIRRPPEMTANMIICAGLRGGAEAAWGDTCYQLRFKKIKLTYVFNKEDGYLKEN